MDEKTLKLINRGYVVLEIVFNANAKSFVVTQRLLHEDGFNWKKLENIVSQEQMPQAYEQLKAVHLNNPRLITILHLHCFLQKGNLGKIFFVNDGNFYNVSSWF